MNEKLCLNPGLKDLQLSTARCLCAVAGDTEDADEH